MAADLQNDWNPGAYARFRGLRFRPALDLFQALPDLPAGDVIDLGCGDGAAAALLRGLGRRVIGVDASPAMLQKARDAGGYDALDEADIANWSTAHAPALIYSNAALHWVKGHEALLPRLADMLVPGGVLAVQVPHQNNAPSHRVWLSLVDEMFPGAHDTASGPGVLLPADYHRILSPLGRLSLWETEYYQALPTEGDGHPVRRFTEATFARPILASLAPDDRARLIDAYEAVMDKAYPRGRDGTVLFPFRRLFFTLQV